MAREPSAAILDPLRRLVTRQTGSSLTDTQLLDNFVSRRDEASFEVLVWRHGAMVLAVCKRVLRDSHEAEDAFQATFLVFSRKASSIGRGEVVAAWLYKVAYRVALRLRAAAAKRAATGEPADALPAPEAAESADWLDLKPVLDDEIAKLPEKYRAPFVLCYLEGRTNEEAAVALGCPKGTVLSRLSRGREWLRERLARRGVALSATAFALAITQNAVSAALVTSTSSAAVPFAAGTAAAQLVPLHVAALAEGMLKTMTLIKAKIAASLVALVALGALGTSMVWAAHGDFDSPTPAPVALGANTDAPRTDADANAQREGERDRPAAPAAPGLSGKVTSGAKDGKSFTVETPPTERGGEPGKATVKFADKATVTYNGVGFNGAAPTEGYQAQVWFEGNSKEIAATVVFTGTARGHRTPDVVGTVVNGKDNKSVTIETRARVRADRDADLPKETVAFDDKTVLIFSNVGKGEAKVAAGQQALVWYADDVRVAGNLIAAKVQFIGTAEERRRDEKRPDSMGKVMRTDGKTLVIESPPAERGGEPTRTTIKTDDKTAFVFNNVPADGAKAAPGMQVQVWLAEGSKDTAAKVSLTGTVPERWATANGKVVAVAKDGNSYTIELPPTARGEEPKRVDVKITAKTKVAFFGVGPGEAKIAEGMMSQARLVDGSPDTAADVVFGKVGLRSGRER